MSNMSYCRFQNTVSDLRDCHEALSDLRVGDIEKLSEEELRAAKKLAIVCLRIVTDLADEAGLVTELPEECDLEESVQRINDCATS